MLVLFNKITTTKLEHLDRDVQGKTLGIISTDLLAIEKGLKTVPFSLAVPFANLYGLILLGTLVGW